MTKNDIGSILKESEESLARTNEDFVKTVKDDLQQLKQKALEKI